MILCDIKTKISVIIGISRFLRNKKKPETHVSGLIRYCLGLSEPLLNFLSHVIVGILFAVYVGKLLSLRSGLIHAQEPHVLLFPAGDEFLYAVIEASGIRPVVT